MTTMLSAALLVILMLVGAPKADAQVPSLLNLARDVDQAASNLNNRQDSLLGFKKLEMPKLLSGLVDVRLKKPTIPGLGLLDKLKNFGKPQVDGAALPTQGPILAGLSKLLPQRNTSTPSLMDRILGKTSTQSSGSSLFGANELNEIARATQSLQDNIGRMSQEARASTSGLFEQTDLTSPQPPLRTARQYSDEIKSRF